MRALLVFSLVFLPLGLTLNLAGVGSTGTGAAFAQSSGSSASPPEAAQSAPGDAGGADSAARPKPKLDSLLRPRTRSTPPPSSTPQLAPPTEDELGGRSREGWAKAFVDARTELREAEERLEKSRKKMSEVSQGGGYTYNPLGGTDSSPTDPEVQKARAQMGRDRKDIEAAKARLRELSVEASLAGVPDEWIPPAPPSSPGASKSDPAPADSARPE